MARTRKGLMVNPILNVMEQNYNPLNYKIYFRFPQNQMPDISFYDLNSDDRDKKRFANEVYYIFRNFQRQPLGADVPAQQLKSLLESQVSGSNLHLLNDVIDMSEPLAVDSVEEYMEFFRSLGLEAQNLGTAVNPVPLSFKTVTLKMRSNPLFQLLLWSSVNIFAAKRMDVVILKDDVNAKNVEGYLTRYAGEKVDIVEESVAQGDATRIQESEIYKSSSTSEKPRLASIAGFVCFEAAPMVTGTMFAVTSKAPDAFELKVKGNWSTVYA